MSSEPVSEGEQFHQRSNGEGDSMLTPTCSISAMHNSMPAGLLKDSGISQVFFPSDFEGNSTSEGGSPLSPVLEDNVRC